MNSILCCLSFGMHIDRGAKVGEGGVAGVKPPPLILKDFFNCSHMLLCAGYFCRGGGVVFP